MPNANLPVLSPKAIEKKRASLVEQMTQLSGEIAERQVQFDRIKSQLRENESGRLLNGAFTVYKVSETVVKRHTRRGYKAVRFNVPR